MNSKKEIPFKLSSDGFIILNIDFYYIDKISNEIEKSKMRMLLDTGCNSTVLNINFAKMLGFEVTKKTPKSMMYTASGIVTNTYKYKIPLVEIPEFGYNIENMELQIFDAMIDEKEYVGYLGLDFFKNTTFTINMTNQTILII